MPYSGKVRPCGCAGQRHRNICLVEPITFAWRCRHTDRRHYSGGLCNPCYTGMIVRRMRRRDPKKYRHYMMRHKLKTRYGITPEEYDRLSVKQKGRCLICRRKCETGRRLAVDHHHKRRTIRGLLCMRCNRGISLFREDIYILRRAVKYLLGKLRP